MSWDPQLFARHLKTRRFGRQLRYFTEIDSTNRWLTVHWNEFTLNGAVVIAEHQISGRGRFAREWDDVPGKSLLFSVSIVSSREENRAGFHQMLPAISLAKALLNRLGNDHEIRLKWPNDVLLNGRKLAGILAERFTSGDTTVTIVGVGINVNADLRELSESARAFGTTLFAETGTITPREPLLADIINEWEPLYDSLRDGDTDSIRKAWLELGPPIGTAITRMERGAEISGTFGGIGTSGQLLLRDQNGVVHEFFSGDILH
ncbi:biotin--[acetyl-CoA-carboxylase] ligase [bacterium]|nr:biotin--[acetyl-CoA-carboxylase] ligase [bacterium]